MVRIAGSLQEHVQNGDVCNEKQDFELYRLVLQMFFLLDAITTSFQTQGILLLFGSKVQGRFATSCSLQLEVNSLQTSSRFDTTRSQFAANFRNPKVDSIHSSI